MQQRPNIGTYRKKREIANCHPPSARMNETLIERDCYPRQNKWNLFINIISCTHLNILQKVARHRKAQ